jgi:hypothetical protein
VDSALKALGRTASFDANDPHRHSVTDIGRMKRQLSGLRDNLRTDLLEDDSQEGRREIMLQYIRDVQKLVKDLSVFRQDTVGKSSAHTAPGSRNEDRRLAADPYHGGRHAPKTRNAVERERQAWADIADREKNIAVREREAIARERDVLTISREREERVAWRERQAIDHERAALAKVTKREEAAAVHEREALERERQTLLTVADREKKVARREQDTTDWERKVAERHGEPIIICKEKNRWWRGG